MKICPACKGEKYVLDADTGWGDAGPGDYDGPPAPEYSECEYCHGSGSVPDWMAPNPTTPIDAAAVALLDSYRPIFFGDEGFRP